MFCPRGSPLRNVTEICKRVNGPGCMSGLFFTFLPRINQMTLSGLPEYFPTSGNLGENQEAHTVVGGVPAKMIERITGSSGETENGRSI